MAEALRIPRSIQALLFIATLGTGVALGQVAGIIKDVFDGDALVKLRIERKVPQATVLVHDAKPCCCDK